MWHRRETRRQTEKTNIALPSGECPVYSKPRHRKRLLARRFGPLPVWATQRIDAAPVARLDTWLDGIFDAASVEELIGGDVG